MRPVESNTLKQPNDNLLIKGEREIKEVEKLTLSEANLEICEHPDGLLITQGEECYIASKYLLTDDIRHFITACVENGLVTAIRHNHPRPNLREKGVGYIGFSRVPSERWVCVVDINSPCPKNKSDKLKRITFEKHYRFFLERSDVPWEPEWSNAGNIWVNFIDFDAALKACAINVEKVEKILEQDIGNLQKIKLVL